jgi:hypothetical protein
MAVLGVCSKFVENSGSEHDFLFDVLYRFLQDGGLRIAIDTDGRVLDHYGRAAADSYDLKRC